MELAAIIRQRIQQEGPLSFRDFMEMALYYPELGYFNILGDRIGIKGDFYTSSILNPVFGALLGRQLEQMWELLGKGSFTIVEYGAGTGALCYSILAYLKNNPPFYEQLQYCIIEKSPVMRDKEKRHLLEKVSWYDSIHEIAPFTGCIVSNELVDNLAVHQVVMQEELREVFLEYQEGFVEVLKPASEALTGYMEELQVQLPPGFRTEINLQATQWIQEIATSLQKGYVITIDYGDRSAELYRPSRSAGTLVCYQQHQMNTNPYQHIGAQDITAHVNFSALIHWGLKAGLNYHGLTNQGHFLAALGFSDYLLKTADPRQDIVQTAREVALLTHTLLVNMGRRFKVLIQGKEAPPQELLGLRLSLNSAGK